MESVRFDVKYGTTCAFGDIVAIPYEIFLSKGIYRIQLWGASGGDQAHFAGPGGYATAILKVLETTKYFLYVGSAGNCSTDPKGGCNGAGNGYYGNGVYFVCGGGGSTDLRTSSAIDDRILIAGGGGGGKNGFKGGFGGGNFGGNPSCPPAVKCGTGANQTSGGTSGKYGKYIGDIGEKFYGKDGIGDSLSSGGSGGGYYGGSGQYESSGAGGSGFIKKEVFISGKIQQGDTLFNSPFGNKVTGNYGDGFARITLISSQVSCAYRKQMHGFVFVLIMLISYSAK